MAAGNKKPKKAGALHSTPKKKTAKTIKASKPQKAMKPKKPAKPSWLIEGNLLIQKSRTESMVVDAAELQYIQGKGRCSSIHLRVNEKDEIIPSSFSLSQIGNGIINKGIKRVHKSFIVNCRHIVMFKKQKHKKILVLKSGVEIPLSRRIFH